MQPSPSVSAMDYRHVVFEGRKRSGGVRIPRGRISPSPLNPPITRPCPFDSESLCFVRSVLQFAGIDMDCYRAEPLARRVPAVLRVLRAASIEAAQIGLREHPELVVKVLDALLIGVTEFFRDSYVFELLRERVLPRLQDRPRLAVWSAGCSTGDELYSVAALISELGPAGRATLLGSDCRASAVSTAQRRSDQAVQICLAECAGSRASELAALFSAIEWRVADVFDCREREAWDLILCRNLVIYLEPQASLKLWHLLAGALRPGGFLVVGKAERPGPACGLTRVGPCVFRKGER